MKSILLLVFLSMLVSSSCQTANVQIEDNTKTPKNVILLIGDGTGLSQISSAFYFKESTPNYSRFKHIGLIKTSSSKEDITDSAAGATAFASGIKTYNGAIGVADDSTEVQTIVELVSPKNIKTGVISTSSIVHATPASFYAHAINRGLYEDIAVDLASSDIDFIAGGGTKFFVKRADGRNLFDEMRAKQFKIDTTVIDNFNSIKSLKKTAYLLGEEHMPPTAKGRGDFLPKATELGIRFLNKDNSNFFLTV